MRTLLEPLFIANDPSVRNSFHVLFYQGEDQANAAFKGGHRLGTRDSATAGSNATVP